MINGRFKRTERGNENKIIDISLADFLQEDISKEYLSAELIYFIDPQSYTSQFHNGRFVPKDNKYFEGNYPIPLSKFIENTFCKIFDLHVDDFYFTSSSDDDLTELQYAEEALAQHKIETSPEVTLLWLDYIYIKDEYNKITKEQYRDFIELSSPLDYMGDS
jgi:hypothetical protein